MRFDSNFSRISKSFNYISGLKQGIAPSGDMIPWNVARQFQDDNFPSLSGARIVRIATHPSYQSMGYGSKAIELLQSYYEMKLPNIDSVGSGEQSIEAIVDDEDVSLLEETIKPRKNLPPLLLQLSERKPEKLDYLGVSYGLTRPLLKFWTRGGNLISHFSLTLRRYDFDNEFRCNKSDVNEELFFSNFSCRFLNPIYFFRF